MARRTADRAISRVAVVGAASPAGAHLKAALADRGVPGARVELFGHRSDLAVLSEYDGEARLVQSASELSASDFDAVFVCETGHDLRQMTEAASQGAVIVDLTGSIPGAALAGDPGGGAGSRLISVPHPVTTLVVGLLAPIQRALGLGRVSTFVLRPASDFGEAGLEELREQTVHLLRFEPTPTDVFGRQLAFNVVPEALFPSGEQDAGARVVRETRALLGAPTLALQVSQALVPIFFGHALAAHLELPRAGREEALAAWKSAGDVELAVDSEIGATLDAPERPGLLISRVEAAGDGMLRVWALGSEAGATAAGHAIEASVAAGVL